MDTHPPAFQRSLSQPLPVVRQLYWPGLLPQICAIALFSSAAWFALPARDGAMAVFIGAGAYLIFCRVMRLIFVRDHACGMQAYRAGRFREAIAHFEASHRFFSSHPRLDACRSILFGVASHNPYGVIARCNMAFCHGQLGEGARAIELYEQVLREVPGHAAARASLNLLRANAPTVASTDGARSKPS